MPDRAEWAAYTRQHELDHTDQDLSALKDLDHELWEPVICPRCEIFVDPGVAKRRQKTKLNRTTAPAGSLRLP